MDPLAVYTTVYPGVEPYLADWYRSVAEQTDQDFQLWIGVDGLAIEDVVRAFGGRREVTWVPAAPGDSHAQVRQQALAQIVRTCSAVVLVDSDDVLHPTRVQAARAWLTRAEVSACALRLVDQEGTGLDVILGLTGDLRAEDVLPRHNVFGLSNSTYSCAALSSCLPIPDEAVLIDWFLVTSAWLKGVELAFDNTARMDYRQHRANTARVLPPFTAEQIAGDTALVEQHLGLVRACMSPGDLPDRCSQIDLMATDVARFQERIVTDPARLADYTQALNALQASPLWWWCVAHPSLRHLWTDGEESA